MPSFKLPRLKANLPIVNGQGRPLDYFLRLFNIELAQKIEEQEATQAEILAELQAVQQTQQDEIDRLNRVLAGTEAFSAVNVDGTIVAENAGLAVGIVGTPAIAMEAVTDTDGSATFIATEVDVRNGSGKFKLVERTITVAAGERVEILGSSSLSTRGAGGGGTRGDRVKWIAFEIQRDGSVISNSRVASVLRELELAWTPVLPYTDDPGPGTFTYSLWENHGTNDDDTSFILASDRRLSTVRVKR